MNRIFRTLWSVATQSWQAVPETAKTAGKKSKSSAGGVVASVALSYIFAGGAGAQSPPAIQQLPTGGTVVRGNATINQTATAQAAAMTVNQNSQRAVVNWNTFNIGSSASVNFVQPNAQAVTLNRVNDSNPSQIFGRITSNGQVFLTNANGVYFSPSASVDVGAITATSLSISDDNFMSGKYVFERKGATGRVINEGRINAALGGYVALLAPEVQNAGVVVARAGTVAMAAGEMITLKLEDSGSLAGITTTPSTIATLIENKQAVQAPDGLIILSAMAFNQLQAGVIKNSGSLEANSLVSKGGKIYLEADDITLANTSKLEAKGATGGGTVLVGGDWQGSGDLRQATRVTMETGASIDASATHNGDGGKVVLWSDVHNTTSETKVSGAIYARAGVNGGDGGQIETSGHMLDANNATGDASAPHGRGGEWLFDPYNVTITTANARGGFDNNSPTTWVATANSSTILNTSIQDKLNAGTSVKVSTSGGGTDAGNITVSAPISSTNINSSLSLIAEGDIAINDNINLASGSGQTFLANAVNNISVSSTKSITTQGANVQLLSNSTASSTSTNGAGIKLGSGSTITTNGGDILLAGGTSSSLTYAQGGTSTNTVGVLLTGNNALNSGNGAITIKGAGAALSTGAMSGVEIDAGTSFNAGTGKIDVLGKNSSTASPAGSSAYGVFATGANTFTSLNTDANAIAIQGLEGSAPVADSTAGIHLTGATFNTTNGGIALKSDRMVWGTNTWNTSALTIAANTSGVTTGISMPANVTFNANSTLSTNFSFNGAFNKTNATRSTLTVLSGHDIALNGALGATSGALNVSLTANNNLSLASNSSISTNGGNFYVGAVALDAYDTLTTKGNDFSMGSGSFIHAGTGIFNLSVNGNIQLPSQTSYANRYAITNLGGTSYYNNGAIVYGSKALSLSTLGGNITTLNTEAIKPDIVTSVDTVLTAHNIGTDGSQNNGSFNSTAIKLSGPTDPYGLLIDSANSRATFINTARALTINNLFGSSFIDEMRVQNFRSIAVNLNNQLNQTQNISIMGDAAGAGHLRLNTDGSGVLSLAANDIKTGGIPGTSTSDPSIFPTSVSLSNSNMEFATGSVNTGSSVNYYYQGAGSAMKAYGMLSYAATFSATGTNLTGAGSADGLADIQSSQIYLTGINLGTSAKPIEMSACFGIGNCATSVINSLDFNNLGGSTFARITDNSYSYINLKNINATGEHHLWWSGGDHIDFASDSDVAYKISSISNDSNSSANYGVSAPTGINTSRLSTNLKLYASSGQVALDTNSVNTNLGAFTVDVFGTGATVSHGKVGVGDIIYGTHTKDGQAEITAGIVTLNSNNTTTPAHIVDIEVAATSNSSPTNQASLSLSNSSGGNIDFTELTPGFYKTISITLSGAQRADQKIDVTLASPNGSASADGVHLVDGATQLTLDANKVKLSEYNRNFTLSATGRNIQIDGVSLGTGSYGINAQNIALNSDVLTDGGGISLYALSAIQLKKSVRIDSNSDNLSNSTSTGAAGNIIINSASLTASANGQDLVIDSSSSTTNGGVISYYTNTSSNGNVRVNNLTLDSSGAPSLDGAINLYGSHALNNGFHANGRTLLYSSVNISSASGGDVKFSGDYMNAVYSLYSLTIDTSQSTGNANGGNVDIYNTNNHSVFIGSGININASGSGTGISGTVDLSGMSMATYLGPAAVTVKGGVINLHGNITTLRGGVSLTGDLRLFQDTTINTWQIDSTSTASAAGNVTIAGIGASSQPLGTARTLTINTSTNTGNLDANTTTSTIDNWTQNAGTVNVAAGNGSGVALASLTVNSTASGATNLGTASDITINGVITTGAQSYTGNGITVAAASQSTTNNIQINALNNVSINAGLSAQTLTLTSASGKTISGNGDVVASNLLLNGAGVNYTLNTATSNQVGTLAASIGVGNLAFQNSTAFTVGTIGAVSGITTSGTLNLASTTGDISINNQITSTNTTASAVVINAGKSKNSRDNTGGNVVFGTGIRVVLDAAATGKIYSGSLAETTLATMIGSGTGRFRYDSDEVTTSYTTALSTGLYGIYRQRPTLSSAASDVTKTYDGLAFSGNTSVTYSGYVNGDVSPNVAGYGANNTINAGSYDITVSGAISGLGYDVTPSNFKLTVTPRILTITASALNKVYDGTNIASVSLASNKIATDSLTLAQTGATFSDQNAGTNKTVTVSGLSFSGTSALNYTLNGVSSTSTTASITAKALTMTGLSSSNKVYDGTRTASVSGTPILASTESIGSGNSADGKAYVGDDVSITGTALGTFNTKDVSTATSVSFSGMSLAGAQANNYTLVFQTAVPQSITPKALSMSGLSSSNKIYDGTTTASVSGVSAMAAYETAGTGSTSDGKAYTGDTVSIAGTAIGTFNNKNVNTATQVAFSGLSLTGAQASNYSLTIQSPVQQSITPKALSMSGLTSLNKTYDGTTSASVGGTPVLASAETAGSGATNDGKAYLGDAVSITGTAVGTFNSKDVSSATSVTFSGLALTGNEATNYSLTMQAAASQRITPKALSMSGLSSTDKIYDGTTFATVTGTPMLSSFITAGSGSTSDGKAYTGDVVEISGTAVGTFSSKDVSAVANTVSFSGLNLIGTQSSNYSLTIQTPVAQHITPKALTMNGLSVANKTYDASLSATLIGTAVLQGAESAGSGTTGDGKPYTGDVVIISGTPMGVFNSKDVSTATTVSVSGLSLGGAASTNYSLTPYPTISHGITAKTVSLSANKVYDATTNLAGAVSISTGVGSEVLSYVNATASDAHVATANKYISAITLTNATGSGVGLASNYQLPTLDAAHAGVTITAATITPTLINSGITKIYDGLTTAPLTFVPTYTFTGLISGDTAASLNYTAANYNTPNVSTANSITVSGMSVASITGTNNSASTDYVLNSSSKNIAASITPKTISLSATKTYDGTTSLSGAVSITTGVGNETLTSTNAIASDAHVVTANKYITAITLANGTGLASNYQLPTLDVSNAAVTINAAVLTPTLSNTGVSKTYDGTTNGPGGFTPTYTFSGLANGDSTALLNYTSTTYNNANVASASQVTVSGLSIAAITGTRASAPTDYVLDATAKHVNAVITPKTLIVQANDDAQFVTRADAINFAGASYSGFVTNESTANLSGTLSITRTNSTTTAAGVYNNVLLPSGLSSTNYNIVNQAGQYTIVPANQLLVRVANSTTTYGTSPALSISSAQYLASDNTTIRDLTSSINTSNGVFSLTDGSSGSAQFGLSLNNPTLSGAGMPTVGIWDITANNINRTSSNFSNNLVVVGSQTINPKPLTINVTATNKVYDGTAIATPSLSTTDVLTGDNVNLLVGAANFANKNAGTAKTVAATGLGLNGTDIGNYVLQNISAITTADITPKTLTISVTAPDKVYDGTTTAAPSLSITAGLVGNETLLVDGTASFNSKNVRDAQRVTVDSVHLSDGTQGGLASNYSLPTGQSTTAHITPKPLTASVVAEDKNYDGKLTATTALTITSGLIGQETLNASSEASFSDINAGIKKTVTVDSINLNDASDGSGGLASNYSLMPGQTTTATIRPKMLVPNQEPKVRISNDSALSIPRNEPVQLSSIIEPQIELPVETSEGIVFNHFKAPTEKSIGIMAIRLPKDIAYTSKDLTVALADEIDFSHSHDIENIRIKTVDNQPAPSWIRFDAAQKALIISDQASKETLPLQLILHMGEHRYLMQISESNYITPTL